MNRSMRSKSGLYDVCLASVNLHLYWDRHDDEVAGFLD